MSPDALPYYIEINVFTMLILLLLHSNVRRKRAVFANEILYRMTLIVTMVAMICDSVAVCLDGTSFAISFVLLWVTNIIYFISSLAIPYFFLAYVRTIVNPKASIKDLSFQLVCLPFYAFAIETLMSPMTGRIFTITSDNVYLQGPFRSLHALISIALLIAAVFYILYWFAHGYITDVSAIALAGMVFIPMIGVIGRFFIKGTNLIWTSLTFALLIAFMSGQSSLISTDALTGLNNRIRFGEYMKLKLTTLKENERLFYTILDLNYFKQINDTFGHKEGDRALVEFADILRRVVGDTDDFLARFGGDEFVLISVRPLDGDIETEIMKLDLELRERNEKPDCLYRLSVSFGTAATTKAEGLTAEELLVLADEEMYRDKGHYHGLMKSVIRGEEKEQP